jgi:hypothetical protein
MGAQVPLSRPAATRAAGKAIVAPDRDRRAREAPPRTTWRNAIGNVLTSSL